MLISNYKSFLSKILAYLPNIQDFRCELMLSC